MSGMMQVNPFGHGASSSLPHGRPEARSHTGLHFPTQSMGLLQGVSGIWQVYPRGQGGKLPPHWRPSAPLDEVSGVASAKMAKVVDRRKIARETMFAGS